MMKKKASSGKSWSSIFYLIFQMPEMKKLKSEIEKLRKEKTIYPSREDMFAPFNLCPYDDVKMVIFDTEPYCLEDISDGLAFSSKTDFITDTTKNILGNIYGDLNIQYKYNLNYKDYFKSGSLKPWATNGILLINQILTVEKNNPLSHEGLEWDMFIDKIIDALNDHQDNILFLLWGTRAKMLEPKIDTRIGRHQVLKHNHPSELFNTCKHFSIARDILPIIQDKKYVTMNFNEFFDIDNALKKVQRIYPMEKEKIEEYFRHQLQINYWIDQDHYKKYLRNFELSFKTY